MTDIQLAKDVMDIWDKEWPSEEEGLERACHYGGGIYGGGYDFTDIWNELHQKDEPDMEMVFDYIFNAFYYEVLKFCGCGCPPEMMMTLLDLLECFTIDEDDDRLTVPYFGFTGEKLFKEKFRTEDPRLMEFMVKYLDSLGLCEHGTSWHGSWLTSKGKPYRELLRKCKEMEFEEI
jgi:hypothetical protein